jgi:hypothetical protein
MIALYRLYKKFCTAGHCHILFSMFFSSRQQQCAMMANDAQEETSHDTKRRVQQFIKGTIEMQNDDRLQGLPSEAGNI